MLSTEAINSLIILTFCSRFGPNQDQGDELIVFICTVRFQGLSLSSSLEGGIELNSAIVRVFLLPPPRSLFHFFAGGVSLGPCPLPFMSILLVLRYRMSQSSCLLWFACLPTVPCSNSAAFGDWRPQFEFEIDPLVRTQLVCSNRQHNIPGTQRLQTYQNHNCWSCLCCG